MNQTKKRLAIIELAISITDIETIKLQLLRLQPLRSDADIHQISSLLEDENYAQAQALIRTYIDTPTQTVIQRIPEEEQAIINQFDFLEIKSAYDDEEEVVIEKESKQDEIEISTDEIEKVRESTLMDNKRGNNEQDKNTLDRLLTINVDDIMTDNIKINVSTEEEPEYIKEKIDFHLDTVPKDSFFDAIQQASKQVDNNDDDVKSEFVETIPKALKEIEKKELEKEIVEDDFFKQEAEKDNHTYLEGKNAKETKSILEMDETEKVYKEKETIAEIVADIETPSFIEEENDEEITIITPKPIISKKDTSYDAITHIHHLLEDLQIQYPPVHKTNDVYSEELEAWLEIISEKGYSESDVEDVLQHIEKLAHTDKVQAALFLLATSATKSQYAQFILARALYRGTLLQRNLDESFRIMSQLAFKDKYPEALCDLAQFYENGIAVDKDKSQAKVLYKEAMELGVQRAVGHYARLMKEPKGLFSFFKK